MDATIYLYGDRFFDPADHTSIIKYSPHFFDSAKCCRVDCGVWYFALLENIWQGMHCRTTVSTSWRMEVDAV